MSAYIGSSVDSYDRGVRVITDVPGDVVEFSIEEALDWFFGNVGGEEGNLDTVEEAERDSALSQVNDEDCGVLPYEKTTALSDN